MYSVDLTDTTMYATIFYDDCIGWILVENIGAVGYKIISPANQSLRRTGRLNILFTFSDESFILLLRLSFYLKVVVLNTIEW